MAIMIPRNPSVDEFNDSFGEMEVYEALKKLPDNFYVFHSINWNRPKTRGREWGEADFTIYDVKRGLLVVEVKSGYIDRIDGEWFQTNTRTQKVDRIKDPMRQAEKSKYCYVELLEDNNISCWVDCVVWFPTTEDSGLYNRLPPNYHSDNTFLRADMKDPYSAINRAFNLYGVRPNSMNPGLAKKIVEILSPSFCIVPSLSASIAEQNYEFNRLTTEQAYLLDYLEEQQVAAIQGGAGTGKTMIAVEKARRLQLAGKKVLFLCFNRMLLQFLRDRYRKDLTNVFFHNLMTLTIYATGHCTGNEDITFYLENYKDYSWDYDAIIIDEGQDISEEHLMLLSLIAEETCKIFYVFFDRYQLVQQRNNLEWLKSVECRLVLTANCRNTRSIAVTSNRVVRSDEVKMRKEVNGIKPNFYFCATKEQALLNLGSIIGKYVANKIDLNRIVILSMKTEDNSICSGLNKIKSYTITGTAGDNAILFTTCRKFKGLESDIVILVDVDENTFSDDQSRRLFYVGASRAKHLLDILCVIDKANELKMAQCLANDVKNARLTLAQELKVKVCQ